jgi:hypothetical protein
MYKISDDLQLRPQPTRKEKNEEVKKRYELFLYNPSTDLQRRF